MKSYIFDLNFWNVPHYECRMTLPQQGKELSFCFTCSQVVLELTLAPSSFGLVEAHLELSRSGYLHPADIC